MEKAIFAAGCFWKVEEEFRKVSGVVSVKVGYTGGEKENPTYKEVCNTDTGHAEAVEVTFDSEKVPYKGLLEAFWNMHDPTQKDRQGFDFGRQYRSAIFYLNDKQREVAERYKQELDESGKYDKEIETEITPAGVFWEAEEYHQKYFAKQRSEA
ncbi:MAG: peptide-methionine (S)-S-oxide reductase MsrA [Parcubacteria group bacterium]|nr:peptide-methionine (S)-S-oxide reductase MsrA [Parcubacteria group bacterium]